MGSFFESLQSMDESMKQKILVVATVVIMILVVYVWLGYFNGIVAGTSQSNTSVATAQVQPVSSGGNSFWQSMKDDMANMANVFKQPGQYNVQPN
jgi:hypothetical protein